MFCISAPYTCLSNPEVEEQAYLNNQHKYMQEPAYLNDALHIRFRILMHYCIMKVQAVARGGLARQMVKGRTITAPEVDLYPD